ncbi:MAG: hypothetical protein R3B13_20730 [Polyangiaceae bacterium]
MSWRIGQAKQRFSEVLRRAAEEPQLIHDRDRLVAAVIGPLDAEEFLAWRRQRQLSLAEAFDTARQICSEEGGGLELDPRADRKNPLLRVADARQ